MNREPLRIAAVVYPHALDMPLPSYGTIGASGVDLLAAVPEAVLLAPTDRVLVPTGLAIELPEGYEAQVRPRSGLAVDFGVTVLNSPGTIDSDYRGEIQVILVNLGPRPVTIQRGDRIAQLVVAPVVQITLHIVGTLNATERDDRGLGHSGRR